MGNPTNIDTGVGGEPLLEKRCTGEGSCGQIKPLEEFYRRSGGQGGRRSLCKNCYRAQGKAWRTANAERLRVYDRDRSKQPDRKVQKREIERRYKRDPVKCAARSAVRNALRKGTLVRQPCEVEGCGVEPAQGHHDSYLPEDWLAVRWLCSPHHNAHHAAERTAIADMSRTP